MYFFLLFGSSFNVLVNVIEKCLLLYPGKVLCHSFTVLVYPWLLLLFHCSVFFLHWPGLYDLWFASSYFLKWFKKKYLFTLFLLFSKYFSGLSLFLCFVNHGFPFLQPQGWHSELGSQVGGQVDHSLVVRGREAEWQEQHRVPTFW